MALFWPILGHVARCSNFVCWATLALSGLKTVGTKIGVGNEQKTLVTVKLSFCGENAPDRPTQIGDGRTQAQDDRTSPNTQDAVKVCQHLAEGGS